MSVLIRGMQMPKTCGNCPVHKLWAEDDEAQCMIVRTLWTKYSERNPNCPLVEIPPHGDLIDQHRLIDVGNHLKRTVKDRSDLDAAAGVAALLYYVIEAPAIIPAEEASE